MQKRCNGALIWFGLWKVQAKFKAIFSAITLQKYQTSFWYLQNHNVDTIEKKFYSVTRFQQFYDFQQKPKDSAKQRLIRLHYSYYSSGKIRKTQKEHLNIVFQNLNSQ